MFLIKQTFSSTIISLETCRVRTQKEGWWDSSLGLCAHASDPGLSPVSNTLKEASFLCFISVSQPESSFSLNWRVEKNSEEARELKKAGQIQITWLVCCPLSALSKQKPGLRHIEGSYGAAVPLLYHNSPHHTAVSFFLSEKAAQSSKTQDDNKQTQDKY